MNVLLERFFTNENLTKGFLILPDKSKYATIELPWRDNKEHVSCIPVGTYSVARYSSAKYDDIWQVLNVPHRNNILIHWGNFAKNSKGCILVGFNHVKINNIDAVDSSRNAILVLRNKLTSFELTITESY